MIDQLEDLVQDRQIALPEAKMAYKVATWRRVVLADHKDTTSDSTENTTSRTNRSTRQQLSGLSATSPMTGR